MTNKDNKPQIFENYFEMIYGLEMSLSGDGKYPILEDLGRWDIACENSGQGSMVATTDEFIDFFIEKIVAIDNITSLEFRYYFSLLALSNGPTLVPKIWDSIEEILRSEKTIKRGEYTHRSKAMELMNLLTIIRDEHSIIKAAELFQRDWNKIESEEAIGSSAKREILGHCTEIVLAIPCQASRQFIFNNEEMLRWIYDDDILGFFHGFSHILHHESATNVYEFISDEFAENIEKMYKVQFEHEKIVVDEYGIIQISHDDAFDLFSQLWWDQGVLELVRTSDFMSLSEFFADQIKVKNYQQYVKYPSFDNIHNYESEKVLLFSIPFRHID